MVVRSTITSETRSSLPARRRGELRDANCIRVFFGIDSVITKKRQRYLDQFGVVPEYKAGVQVGDVMTARIGNLKRDLVFNGDVLNTGVRIQGECARPKRRLVSSADLFESFDSTEGMDGRGGGLRDAAWKSEPLELAVFA